MQFPEKMEQNVCDMHISTADSESTGMGSLASVAMCLPVEKTNKTETY